MTKGRDFFFLVTICHIYILYILTIDSSSEHATRSWENNGTNISIFTNGCKTLKNIFKKPINDNNNNNNTWVNRYTSYSTPYENFYWIKLRYMKDHLHTYTGLKLFNLSGRFNSTWATPSGYILTFNVSYWYLKVVVEEEAMMGRKMKITELIYYV